MMKAKSQARYCSLLKYFNRGDYSTFKRICNLAFDQDSLSDPFFISNLFIGSQIAGLIEVGENDGISFWAVAFTNDITIIGIEPKQVGTSEKYFESLGGSLNTLVMDWQHRPLILGQTRFSEIPEGKQTLVYDRGFPDTFPTYLEVEDKICTVETFRANFDSYAEAFDFGAGKWVTRDINANYEKATLLRVKREFSGFNYYIISYDLRMLFKINNPEWAFVAFLRLFNLPISQVFTYSSDRISFARGIRLPMPITRFLFASSKYVRVGPSVEYNNIGEGTIKWLVEYLSPNQVNQHAA